MFLKPELQNKTKKNKKTFFLFAHPYSRQTHSAQAQAPDVVMLHASVWRWNDSVCLVSPFNSSIQTGKPPQTCRCKSFLKIQVILRRLSVSALTHLTAHLWHTVSTYFPGEVTAHKSSVGLFLGWNNLREGRFNLYRPQQYCFMDILSNSAWDTCLI